MKQVCVDTPLMVGPGKSYIKAEPLGVVCVMSAWNYPFYTLMGPVSACIAAGNCCLIKPSELSPNCSLVMTKLCQKYLDKSCYQVVQGKAEVSKKLTSMRFDMIVFTGSTQKGKLVAEAAGRNLVPTCLELGGKSPAIIDETADATLAAKKVLFGKMPNLG
jgi:aldehyde dehydrogenase (NAD+)